jgi:hypothetical protein
VSGVAELDHPGILSRGGEVAQHGISQRPITDDVLFTKPSNEPERSALSVMPGNKPRSAGPMSVQPVRHGSIAPTQLRMEPTAGTETQRPKRQSPATEAVRIAKARIMRRNSLRKQRQAQKG